MILRYRAHDQLERLRADHETLSQAMRSDLSACVELGLIDDLCLLNAGREGCLNDEPLKP